MGQKQTDGSYRDSCLDRLKRGEPYFVLRAQDKWAPVLVRMWAMLAQMTNCGGEKVADAHRTAGEMEGWAPRKFPD